MRLSKDLIDLYSETVKSALDQLKIDGVEIDGVEERETKLFEHELIFAATGLHRNLIAMLSGSEGATYLDMPIRMVLVPPQTDGTLMTDETNSQAFADVFYTIENGRIRLIQTTTPLPIHGLSIVYDSLQDEYQAPLSLCVNRPRLVALAGSKIETREVLEKGGIKLPNAHVLEETDFKNLPKAISQFRERNPTRGFVVKGDIGYGGENVKLFTDQETEAAQEFVRKIAPIGRVYLEERIEPLEWVVEGEFVDWNIRSLVTLSSEPRWIDAVVRYRRMSSEPVNIHNGASGAELSEVAKITGASIEDIKDVSLRIAKIIYDEVSRQDVKERGLLGLDLIVSRKDIYAIEVNAEAVGGFGSLMKLRRQPPKSFKIFLEDIGDLLYQNKNKPYRQDVSAYRRLPNSALSETNTAEYLARKGNPQRAIQILTEVVRKYPNDREAQYSLNRLLPSK